MELSGDRPLLALGALPDGGVRGSPRCPHTPGAGGLTHSGAFSEGKGTALGAVSRCQSLGWAAVLRVFKVRSALLGVSGEHRPDLASLPPAPVPDFGRFTSIPDVPSQLQTASLEDLLCPHAPLSGEDDAAPSCATSSHTPFKAFLSPSELHAPRSSDRKLPPLLSPLQDPLVDKTLLEPREMARPKKVCFSESSLTSGDRTRRSYYLNGRQGGPRAVPHSTAAAAGKGVWWPAGHGFSIRLARRGQCAWEARGWGCACSDLFPI